MRRLLRGLGALAVLIPSVCPLAADAPTVEQIRDALARGRTVKAARLADRALQAAAPADAPELRYLLFKIHVVDLGPGADGDLYKKIAGDAPDGMEIYGAYLDGLEASVRSEGRAALPALVDRLGRGDRIDRLLVLGLLQDMAAEAEGPVWGEPAGPGLDSPVGAALPATREAAEDCAAREQALGIAAGAAAIEDQLEREAYVQEVFAVEAGVEFLAQVDPAAWGSAAAGALACRGALGAVLDDRERLERYASHLRGPLRRMLDATIRHEVRLTSLELLGAYGGCEDLPAIDRLQGEPIHAAASASGDRIRRRLDCAD